MIILDIEKGSILRCITPPDNKLYFICIDDEMYIEMMEANNCIKINDANNIFKSDFFPIIRGSAFEDIEENLAIMLDKVYTGKAKCAFVKVGNFSDSDYKVIKEQFYLLYNKGFILEATLSSRIDEDTLFMEGIKALKENDLYSFCDVYDQVVLPGTKSKLFFEAVRSENLPCINACLKRGMYVDIRDDNGNTALSKILFSSKDGNPDICKRLVISGASIDVALSHRPKRNKKVDQMLLENLRYIESAREELQESEGDAFE